MLYFAEVIQEITSRIWDMEKDRDTLFQRIFMHRN